MPLPPNYNGTQFNYNIRTIDLAPIEPSIREGEFLIPSLYGTDAAIPIWKYAPINNTVPYILGSHIIPTILTCDEGQWSASPSVRFTYQWKADGIDLVGETNRKIIIEGETLDGKDISCTVTGFNLLGSVTVNSSNSINVSYIRPTEVRDYNEYVILGLPTDTIINSFNLYSYVIYGIPQEPESVIYSTYAYVINIPEILDNINIINPSAETNDTSGWVIEYGSLNINTPTKTTMDGGTKAFNGGSNSFTKAYQIIEIPSTYDTLKSLGQLNITLSWNSNITSTPIDTVTMDLIFLDKNSKPIYRFKDFPELYSPDIYFHINFVQNIPVPVNAKYIKIYQIYYDFSGDVNITSCIDNIKGYYTKTSPFASGEEPQARVFTDPYYDKVVTLLNFNTDNPLIDSSIYEHDFSYRDNYAGYITTTSSENMTVTNNALAFNIYYAGYDYIHLKLPLTKNLDFNSKDFTIEGWAKLTTDITTNTNTFDSRRFFIGKLNTNLQNYIWSLGLFGISKVVSFYLVKNNIITEYKGTTGIPLNTPFHFAFTRTGTTLRVFINGVMEITVEIPSGSLFDDTKPLIIGSGSYNSFWRGYMSSIRITNGISRYNTDNSFTLPTQPYSL